MRRAILDLRGESRWLRRVGGRAGVGIRSQAAPSCSGRAAAAGRGYDLRDQARRGLPGPLPLVVLIDEHTASAAEATAASLQDHDRALLARPPLFWKGAEQMDFFLMPMQDVLHHDDRAHRLPQWAVHPAPLPWARGRAVLRLCGQVRGGAGHRPDLPHRRRTPGSGWRRRGTRYRRSPRRVLARYGGAWPWTPDSRASVADSVANTLPATPAGARAWMGARADWSARLLPPFLNRVRSRFHIAAQTDSLLDRLLAAESGLRGGAGALGARRGRGVRPAERAPTSGWRSRYFPKIRALLSSPPK